VYAVYSLLLGLAFFVILPVYFIRLRILKRERLNLSARLGRNVPRRASDGPCLWVHAVSVGEVLSLQNLLAKLKSSHPGWEVAFSTLTNSGNRVAAERLRMVDRLFFVPLDFAGPVRRVLRALRPNLLVLVESEFWPRLLREAHRSGVRVLVVNGRISERSGRRLKRFRPLSRRLLGNIDGFLVQTARDEARLEAAGVAPGRIAVAGNLKCETRLPEFGPEAGRELRAQFSIPVDKKILVAGSIHPGEGERLISAFREARARRDDILFVLVPRHPEKFNDVEKMFTADAFAVRRKSRLEPGQAWDVLILDTIGDLTRFYALADVAFIGGSLIRWGGQNLLEPAAYSKPVFFGPHMDNFAELAAAFVEGGGAKVVSTDSDLREMFLMEDAEALRRMGATAKAILTSFEGATDKTIAAVEDILDDGHA